MVEVPQVGFEIGLLLRQAHRKAAETFNTALQSLDVQGRHFGALLVLHREGPLSQRELIERLGSDKSSMVRLIDELEARDLCARRPHGQDRRAHAVHLTDAGTRLLARAAPIADSVAAALLADLTPTERNVLRELLTRLLATDTAIDAGAPDHQ